MLFESANTYAPGEQGTNPALGQSLFQNVNQLGRYHLQKATQAARPPNVIMAVVVIALLCLWLHSRSRKRR